MQNSRFPAVHRSSGSRRESDVHAVDGSDGDGTGFRSDPPPAPVLSIGRWAS